MQIYVKKRNSNFDFKEYTLKRLPIFPQNNHIFWL